jgi:Protein of unknown function (DUF1573)
MRTVAPSLALVSTFLFACLSLRAELKPSPAEVDLGKQRQEQVATAKVTLTNAGTKELEIIHVAADCSCTAATPDKKTLAPGESTALEISFQTRNYSGEIHRRVLIQTSEGDVVVPVKTVVSAYDDWLLGAQIAVFRPSNRGEEDKITFNVSYTGSGDAEITEATTSVPWLKAQVAAKNGKTTEIALTKLANAPAGNHQPVITLTTTDKNEPTVTFKAFAAVYSTLQIRPTPILMPPTPVGQPSVLALELAGWEPKEDPRFEMEEAEGKVAQRDGRDVLTQLTVTPKSAGTTTRMLRIYAGESLEAEVPVIIRAE